MARAKAILEWAGLGAAAGVLCGVASAVFLLALEHATSFRIAHAWLVYLLPLAGVAIGFVYERWGKPIAPGTSLIIDSIHEDTPQIPLRMAPMVLAGTVLTHFFGGSAGREGTAVQMGASLADAVAHRLGVSRERRRQLLAAGIAGGFGSVFGTPIAGTVFGLEVVAVGRMEYDALLPALLASVLGDYVTRHLGVVHTAYPTVAAVPLTPVVAAKLVLIGLAMAGATVTFIDLTHALKKWLARFRLPFRMAIGGAVVVALWKLLGADDYLGLGVPMIVRAFSDPALPSYAFALKLLFTIITLGAGFLGGEVTPLFFVGATLGSVLARALGLPIELGAGVGIAAVFGAAANTPLALSVMAVELCGAGVLPHVLIVTVVAYLVSGHRSIYPSQLRRGRK
jgi:H+/Cl- antiporter ClcA